MAILAGLHDKKIQGVHPLVFVFLHFQRGKEVGFRPPPLHPPLSGKQKTV